MRDLRDKAENWSWEIGGFEFLHQEGVVPHSVKTVAAEKVRFGIDPDAVPAGYLAAAAYEWDAIGPSYPSEFIAAIEAELDPKKRDFIAKLLTALGRNSE